MEYNTFRPHSSLGYLPPAPEVVDLNSNFKDGTKNGGRSLPMDTTKEIIMVPTKKKKDVEEKK